MSTVTYKNQPAMQAIKNQLQGIVPLSGTSHPYHINALLWPVAVEQWLAKQFIGNTLHVCCGKSKLGHCRLDLHENLVDIKADADRLPFAKQSWDTILIDPPYNGSFQWNHDMLSELARVARHRIIFQHWFLPVDNTGHFKKSHRFHLSNIVVWQPQTYFGRVNVITIMDADPHYPDQLPLPSIISEC